MAKVERWALAVLFTGIAVLLAACGGGDEKGPSPAEIAKTQKAAATLPKTPAPKPHVEEGEDGAIRYSGETESGESYTAQIGGDVELPASFGNEVPTYAGAKATSAMETGGGTAIAALDTDADDDDVVDFYHEQLGANGWEIVDENELGRGTFLTATKGGQRLLVNVENRDEGSRITLSIGPAS